MSHSPAQSRTVPHRPAALGTPRPQLIPLRPGHRPGPCDRVATREPRWRDDFADLMELRGQADTVAFRHAVRDLTRHLTGRGDDGRRPVTTISARPGVALVVRELLAGRREIGAQWLADQVGCCVQTAESLLRQLSDRDDPSRGWIRRVWMGRKGVGVSVWTIGRRTVAWLLATVRGHRRRTGRPATGFGQPVTFTGESPHSPRAERDTGPGRPPDDPATVADDAVCPDDPLTLARRCAFCRSGRPHP